MPIGLIKKLAGKLTRKISGSNAATGEGASSPRLSKVVEKPVRGSAAGAKGAPAAVWRPGDPVPRVPRTRSSGQSPESTPRQSPPQRRSSRTSVPPRAASGRESAPVRPAEDRQVPGATDGAEHDSSSSRSGSSRHRSRHRGRTPAAATGGAEAASSPVEPDVAKHDPVAPSISTAPAVSWSVDQYVVAPMEGKVRFHDVNIPESILHGVADLGYQYCTPIQARVLQEVAEGHNVAGKAQTGTGKTAAFLILIFKQFLQQPLPADRPRGKPRALILAPTRELVIQIVRDAEAIGKYCGMHSVAVYGGADYDRQERDLLQTPVDLVAATPGRLLDFRRKGTLDLSSVDVLVIDEADRMLDMGFIPDVKAIIRYTPPKDHRRTLLFSATLSDDVMRLASQWMPAPHVVEIEPDHVAVDTVKQLVYMVRAQEKFTVLYNLLKRPTMGRVLVFANRRDQTDRIAFELKRYGISCEVLSGSVDQKKRMRVLDDFRSGKVKTVVATDVAGRGLHVDAIDHVVNFDLPYEAEDYVHRIGRTGRAGAEGTAVSFACEDESFGIPDIEKYMGESLSCLYPEDVLLKPLPAATGPAYVRPPRSGQGMAGRSTGGRGDRP